MALYLFVILAINVYKCFEVSVSCSLTSLTVLFQFSFIHIFKLMVSVPVYTLLVEFHGNRWISFSIK